MAISVTILRHDIVAIMAISTILAIMAKLNMATDMLVIGVYRKNRKTEFEKMHILSVMYQILPISHLHIQYHPYIIEIKTILQ